MNVALHWDDKGDKGDGIPCRGHSFTVWHSRRSDRVNHGPCLRTESVRGDQVLSAVGAVLKPLKPCKRCVQDGKRKAQPAMGKADCQGKP